MPSGYVMLICEATAPNGERFVFEAATDIELTAAGPVRPPTLEDVVSPMWGDDAAICVTRDGGTAFVLAPGWIVHVIDWRAAGDYA